MAPLPVYDIISVSMTLVAPSHKKNIGELEKVPEFLGDPTTCSTTKD